MANIRPYGDLGEEEIVATIEGEVVHVAGPPQPGAYLRTDLGYASQEMPWQQHSLRWGDGQGGNSASEDFADMFSAGPITDWPMILLEGRATIGCKVTWPNGSNKDRAQSTSPGLEKRSRETRGDVSRLRTWDRRCL